MKHALLFLFLISTQSLISQSIQQLDIKNGFQNLKLKDNFLKWKNDLVFLGEASDGSSTYEYIGSCCSHVFNERVNNIKLIFNQNVLVSIRIETEFFNNYNRDGSMAIFPSDIYGTTRFKSLVSSFENLFGKHTKVSFANSNEVNKHNSGLIQHTWIGEKVRLYVEYHWYGTINGDNAVIMIYDEAWYRSWSTSGF